MTWQETRMRWQALREIETAIDDGPVGDLPWNERYEQIFHSRAELLRTLEYRWNLMVQAQLDPELPDHVLAATFREMTLRHAPLLAVFERHSAVAGWIREGVSADVHA